MIVPQEELVDYLGKDLAGLEGRISASSLEKLERYDSHTNTEFLLPAMDYLFLAHQQGSESLKDLSKETGISKGTLAKVFRLCDLPTVTQAEGTRRGLYQRLQDPVFMKRRAEETRMQWQDPEFRKRQAEGVRRARSNPNNIGKYYIPTVDGYRRDTALNAQSTWEANFARILLYCGREVYARETFRLKVTDAYRELFDSDATEKTIDFVTITPRGNIVLYEIRAQHFDDPVSHAKLEMLIQQHPVDVRMVDQKFYERLRKRFEGRINTAQSLSGWETQKDNLSTNPQKYGIIS